MDITAAVAPDKLTPSLSICVVPPSLSGEEWGEGDAGVSCSGKTFFCLEGKKNKPKPTQNQNTECILRSLQNLPAISYHLTECAWFIITKILHTADKSPGKEDQKLSVCIYSYLSKTAEHKLLKKKPTSEKWEKNELYILIHDSSKSYKSPKRCFGLFSCPDPSTIIWVYHSSKQLVGLCAYSHVKLEPHLGVNFTVHLDFPSACFKGAEIFK